MEFEFDLSVMVEEREKMLQKLELKYNNGEISEEEYKSEKEYIEIFY